MSLLPSFFYKMRTSLWSCFLVLSSAVQMEVQGSSSQENSLWFAPNSSLLDNTICCVDDLTFCATNEMDIVALAVQLQTEGVD
ncbi:hypothetical protein ACHAXS_000079 [Conticribra weissflogii]